MTLPFNYLTTKTHQDVLPSCSTPCGCRGEIHPRHVFAHPPRGRSSSSEAAKAPQWGFGNMPSWWEPRCFPIKKLLWGYLKTSFWQVLYGFMHGMKNMKILIVHAFWQYANGHPAEPIQSNSLFYWIRSVLGKYLNRLEFQMLGARNGGRGKNRCTQKCSSTVDVNVVVVDTWKPCAGKSLARKLTLYLPTCWQENVTKDTNRFCSTALLTTSFHPKPRAAEVLMIKKCLTPNHRCNRCARVGKAWSPSRSSFLVSPRGTSWKSRSYLPESGGWRGESWQSREKSGTMIFSSLQDWNSF